VFSGLEDIVHAISRRDPVAAERLRKVVVEMDELIQDKHVPGRAAMVRTAKEMAECL